MIKKSSLWLGPLLAVCMWFLAFFFDLSFSACWTAAITTLCAVWWICEPIAIPATSLIPFAAFPLTGVLTHKEVASAYGHTLILLLLGGFILSTAMEKSGTHRRLALVMIHLVGGKGGKQIVLGFMLATAVLSMWISNTATVLMLLPVALAVLEQSEEQDKLSVPLLLGIAYAASIGGLGTPIGTPPNVIFLGIYKETTGIEISFLEWMTIGITTTAILLPLAWFLLTRELKTLKPMNLPQLGKWQVCERRVLCVFLFAALAWVTRAAPFGGWSALLGVPGAGDSTVAFVAVILLFIIPDGKKARLLDWESANKIPWGLLLLFAGGLAIAKAFQTSGLSETIGSALAGATSLPIVVVIFLLCISVTFLTEITSNTATTTLLMPILAAASLAAGLEPGLLMIPATLSASCAFMLPVATAPNAVVFGSGRVTVKRMATEGLLLNIIGAFAITLVCALLLL